MGEKETLCLICKCPIEPVESPLSEHWAVVHDECWEKANGRKIPWKGARAWVVIPPPDGEGE